MKKFRVVSLALAEISGVRRPAMEGATISIVKSADDLTIAELTKDQPTPSDVHVPTAAGHRPNDPTCTCAQCGAMKKEAPMSMTDDEKKQFEDLKTRLAKSEKFGLLTDIEKAHYNRLSDSDRTVFIEKSAEQRAADVTPVYTCKATGAVFTKSDDSRLVEMAKSMDTTTEANRVALEKAQESTWLAKAEVETSHLPGTLATRASLLKSIADEKDETKRNELVAIVKSANDAIKGQGKRQGTGTSKPILKSGSAQERLDAAVQKHATDKNVPLYKAYDEVLSTPTGGQLYAEVEAEKKAEQN